MEKITEKRLKEAGWDEKRNILIPETEKIFQRLELELPDNVKNFLKNYGYLVFNNKERKEDLEFNPEKAIGINLDKEYFDELLDEYGINEKVYPVGECCRGNMMVLMTTQNIFYCFTDGYLEKAGDSVEEMLDCLVGECKEAEVID